MNVLLCRLGTQSLFCDHVRMESEKTIYRVYLRWPGSRVSDKTVTPHPERALAAFRKLINLTALRGEKVSAALTCNGKQRYFHKFNANPGDPDFIAPDAELSL